MYPAYSKLLATFSHAPAGIRNHAVVRDGKQPGGGGGGGGGGALRYRGGTHLRYVFRGGRVFSLRPPHVRDFVKEGYFFVPRYEVWVSKSPYNPRNTRGSDAE